MGYVIVHNGRYTENIEDVEYARKRAYSLVKEFGSECDIYKQVRSKQNLIGYVWKNGGVVLYSDWRTSESRLLNRDGSFGKKVKLEVR